MADQLRTARTITIGSTSKSFDGSTAVSWTLAEIGAAASSHTHLYLPLAGGTMNNSAQISREATSASWINGRLGALLRCTTYNGYNPLISMKTTNGDWSQGVYTSDTMYWTYCTDTNFTAGTNSTTAQMSLDSTGALRANSVYGAVWNDYAEFRISDKKIEAGRVVVENGDDTLSLSTGRLQPAANIVSDTFGFAIGETDSAKTPIAVSGRVLAYTDKDRNTFKAGDAVCSGPNGTVSKMTRIEIVEYPDRIIGIVSAIPNYKKWGSGDVEVNDRIWIKI